MRRLVAACVVLLAVVAPIGARASHVVPGVTIPNIHESDFQTLFPSAPIAALGQLNYGPPCTDNSDTLWCTQGAVGRFQSAVYAGSGSASGLYAYVYQQDCTGGLVNRTVSHIPWSGAPLIPTFGSNFAYIATHYDIPQDYPPLPTTPFGGNLGIFNLSEFGQLGGTTGDGFTTAIRAPGVYPDELAGDSGFGIFWSGTLLVAVTNRPPVVSHVTQTFPLGGGIGDPKVVALVPEGAPVVDPDPDEWTIDLQLSPETARRPIGTDHTVTGVATRLSYPENTPVVGGTVRFNVTGANSASGTATTSATGGVTFSYTGANEGIDNIFGFLDLNGNSYHDGFEPADSVGATWFPMAAEGYAARARIDAASIDTGKISQSLIPGGLASNSILSHDVNSGTLKLGVGTSSASTSIDPNGAAVAKGTDTIADVSIAGGAIRAEAVKAVAGASELNGVGTTSSSGSGFVGLTVGTNVIAADVPANTTIAIPGVGTVVLREEIASAGPAGASIQVNMIHFTSADGSVEVVVSSAFAGVGTFTMPGQPPQKLPTVPAPGVGLPPVAACLTGEPLMSEGFESGLGSFTASLADPSMSTVWEAGAPTSPSGPGAAAEGTGVAGTLVAGSYNYSSTGFLTSPEIDLSGFDPEAPGPCNGKKATFSFKSWYQSYYYDCGFLQVSTDAGASWNDVAPTPGYNWSYPYYCGGWVYPSAGAFSAYGLNSWAPYGVDLTPFAGQKVHVRFVFGAYYPYYGDDGWSVDAVRVLLS